MGKCRLPAVRVAVPTVPGARPREVSAAANPASRSTAVSTPVRLGMEASGFCIAGAEEDFAAGAVPLLAGLEQAARPATRSPAVMIPTVAFWNLRMM